MSALRELTLCLLGLSLAGSTNMATAQDRDRSKIDDKYKWNLIELYPTAEAWRAAKEKLVQQFSGLTQFKATLSQSPARLLQCLDLISGLSKEYARLSVYANLASDVDTRDAGNLARAQEIRQVGADFSAAAAFFEPEIQALGRPAVESFLAREPKLSPYRHNLNDILRRKAHTGTEGEEKIIADAGLMSDGPSSIFTIFSNADFPFPKVTLHDSTTVTLDKAAFSLYRGVANREDRKKVFEAYFNRLNEYRRTFGTDLYSQVKRDMFYARARKYSSSLESALDGNNIPVEVYKTLVKNVDNNLPTFHRYLALRKRLLGVDQLHYYDLYVPMVGAVDAQFSVDDAKNSILKALAPLGNQYVATVEKAFDSRWIDMYPTTGKVSGAYSSGDAYDVHPYILTNYNGKYDDVSTLAHELGHTMHSYFSNKAQPYPTASYATFVAEVASTFNEALLFNYMKQQMPSDAARLNLLGNYLDGIRGTLFRQVQFAEFELAIHEKAEHGETLTGDGLDALYLDITRKYYGHDHGMCIVDDDIKAEWANIPHFYYTFYVFQYATSLTASSALSEEVIAGDMKARDRYLTLLSAGGSDYPVNLLKKAGVDMTTSVPFDLAVKKMNGIMDEMEKILAKMGK